MTFADLLYKGFQWLEGRFTRILGLAVGTLSIIVGYPNVIPPKYLQGMLVVIAVLTFWRGWATSNTYNQAKAVLSSATAPVVVGPSIVMAPVKEPDPISPVKPASTGDKLG
jgi:hypothetical protein